MMDYKDDIQKDENVSKDAQKKTDAPFDAFSETPKTPDLPTFDASFSDDPTQSSANKSSVNPFEETPDDNADDFYTGLENDFSADISTDDTASSKLFDHDFSAETIEEAAVVDDYPFMNAGESTTPDDLGLSMDLEIPEEDAVQVQVKAEEPTVQINEFKAAIQQTEESVPEVVRPAGMMFVPKGMEAELQKEVEPTFEPLEVPTESLADEISADSFDALEPDDAFDEIDELSLDLADDQDVEEAAKFDMDADLPDLLEGSFDDADADEKFFSHTTSLRTDDLYKRVLHILVDSDDMGIDATAKARINDAMRKRELAPIICRELIAQRVLTSIQFARAVARAQKRKEITNFLNIPHEAMGLRTSLDRRVCTLLRDARVIPLWHRQMRDEDEGLAQGSSELHLAHESSTRDLVLESALGEFLPEHRFVWHFAMRDVGGAFWLSSTSGDIDSSMEAEALLDRIIGNAIDARSSDIHVDPSVKGEFKAIVKYRVDGFVQSKEVITLDQLERLRVRIENIARMPKVDLHHPNKGAFTRSGFDWRVQIQPHAGRQGPIPRIVIRRLQPDVLPMETLGYPEYFINDIKKSAASPNGVILWTGPTGSGKTESIHSAIVSSNPMGRGLSVHTIEDPPEKRVSGYAVQMEMSERDPARSGMELLKSSLRADPDVVVFGEVRDAEMASLVFEAANTGHLVFTTLHTNTSLDAIVRLDELGIYGFNISYVRGIAAQRLVRRVCMHCRQPLSKADEYTEYVFEKYNIDLDGATLFKHDENGCPSCNYSGYSGRIAIAEWLVPNKELVDASTKREYENLEAIARRAGWKPMGYMGALHVKNGITDVFELSAKVQELSGDI
jgi:type II secretory ATPase GspE/PulE/Tfp pilus assembly ATPase PilB-like protein